MTIQAATRRNDAIGNNTTPTYVFSFFISNAADLLVVRTDPLGASSVLVLGVDYTVAGVGLLAGGSVTLLAGNLLNNYKLSIRDKPAIKQSLDLKNRGGFFPEDHEAQFDYLTRIDISQQDEITRSLKFPESDGTGINSTFPSAALRANTFAAFDGNGGAIVAAGTSANLGPVSVYVNTLLSAADDAAFRGLLKLPGSMAGKAGAGLRVKSDESVIEYGGPPRRNLLVNGDFDIWQAGTSLTGIVANGRLVDGMRLAMTNASVWRIDQSNDVPTAAQAGRQLNWSVWLRCTTADAVLNAGDLVMPAFHIEGYDFAPYYNQPLCIYFWVKSNKTGTYSVALSNGVNRFYTNNFTINVANTWELKTVPVATLPAAGGTWNFTNGTGLMFAIVLTAGTTYQGAVGWQNTEVYAVTGAGQVNLSDNVVNEIRIADARLVGGLDATDIVHRSIDEKLRACRRYYRKSYDADTAPGAVTTNSCVGGTAADASHEYYISWDAPMRAVPTVTGYNPNSGATGSWRDFVAGADRAISATLPGQNGFKFIMAGTVSGNDTGGHYVADARF